VPLTVPNASACASGDVELRANLVVGVGGEAKFQLELPSSSTGATFNSSPPAAGVPGFTFNSSVSVLGNWIDALVGWGEDASFETRILTKFSGQQIQVRAAMRSARCAFSDRILHSRVPLDPTPVRLTNMRVANCIPLGSPLLLPVHPVIWVQTLKAELFSLTFGCTQRPHYTQCHRAPDCAAWGLHYSTIPCSTDFECMSFGTCGGVVPMCRSANSVGGVAGDGTSNSTTDKVCVVESGNEPGPVCGWY
jgi:hypothetical protein